MKETPAAPSGTELPNPSARRSPAEVQARRRDRMPLEHAAAAQRSEPQTRRRDDAGASGPPQPPAASRAGWNEPPDAGEQEPAAALVAGLVRLKQSFRAVTWVLEGIAAMRSLDPDEALVEMALYAQSHEQTLQDVRRALDECERLARLAERLPRAPSEPTASSDPGNDVATDPAPVISELESDPAPAAARDIEEEGPVTQVDATASRILIVDDDPTVLRAFRRVLQQNHDVLTARDGAEALRMVLGGARVDAIICDIGMPKLDGPEFFSELFELRPQLMPRVVFCTGGTLNERTQRFLDRLQAPLLFKPVAAQALLEAIALVRGR